MTTINVALLTRFIEVKSRFRSVGNFSYSLLTVFQSLTSSRMVSSVILSVQGRGFSLAGAWLLSCAK